MKRVAIFAEGQTESIFVREFLFHLVDASKMSMECIDLLAKNRAGIIFSHNPPSPEIHFLVMDVHGDEGVVSSIKDREVNLIEEQGYLRIIGLRDMYCEKYDKRSGGVINDTVTEEIKEGCYEVIGDMRNNSEIELFFSIMEIEAWFLAMHNLFERVNSILSTDHIRGELGFDMRNIDPQKEFFKPSKEIDDIMNLCGREYKKKKDEIEALVSKMRLSDFDDAVERRRCSSFASFRSGIEKVAEGYLYQN